jgi:predicted adenine nucleotide alpha hydrolase (AANH) superfamily ATPase
MNINNGIKKKLLLHCCCGPCAVYPVSVFENMDDIQLYALWYNPNIHPLTEYKKRRETLADFLNTKVINLIDPRAYDIENWLRQRAFRETERCRICYYDRIEKTASIAKKGGFEYFTTTLLYSKFQNHETIIQACEEMARKWSVKFFYQDFREGWKKGIEISKNLEMYRQQYCGCIYSEYERYEKEIFKGI